MNARRSRGTPVPHNLIVPHEVVQDEYKFLKSFGTPDEEIARRLNISLGQMMRIVREDKVEDMATTNTDKGISDKYDIFSTLNNLPVPPIDDTHKRAAARVLAALASAAPDGENDLKEVLESVFQPVDGLRDMRDFLIGDGS